MERAQARARWPSTQSECKKNASTSSAVVSDWLCNVSTTIISTGYISLAVCRKYVGAKSRGR